MYVACLIELYQEVLEIERGVLGKHPDTVEKSLKKFLKVTVHALYSTVLAFEFTMILTAFILKGGFLNQYERQKMLAEHMAQENLLHPHRLSPLLVSLCIIVTSVCISVSGFCCQSI